MIVTQEGIEAASFRKVLNIYVYSFGNLSLGMLISVMLINKEYTPVI